VVGAGGSAPWVVATSATAALPGTNYLANSDALVTFTLPASPPIGAVMRFAGGGAGGWKIAQSAAQSIATRGVLGNIGSGWKIANAAPGVTSVASDADMIQLVGGGVSSGVKASNDSGATWQEIFSTPPGNTWVSVASESSGANRIAAAAGSPLYAGGPNNWSPEASGSRPWAAVAIGFGYRLAGVAGGFLYTANLRQPTYVARDVFRDWTAVAITQPFALAMYAAADSGKGGGGIFRSVDQGVTWTPLPTTGNGLWRAIAVSSDDNNTGNTKIVAVEAGGIRTSIDSGNTWTTRESARDWRSVASSADGRRLVAVVFGGPIYTSINSGITWTPGDLVRNWQGVTISADGTRIVAVDGSEAYRSTLTVIPYTTTGVTGSLSGGQYESVELQYVGNNQFAVLSHSGYLSVR
jgi:hypothetical protein